MKKIGNYVDKRLDRVAVKAQIKEIEQRPSGGIQESVTLKVTIKNRGCGKEELDISFVKYNGKGYFELSNQSMPALNRALVMLNLSANTNMIQSIMKEILT